MNAIDLHMHSTESDGSLKPESLVEAAQRVGLKTIALTDHDTVSGLAEARRKAESFGMEFIDGIEISAEFHPGTMHILGYFFNPQDAKLLNVLNDLQKARSDRNPEIIRKLQAAGVDITYDEVCRAAGGGQVGRPHFAKVLVQKKAVRSYEDAFNKFLKKGAAAYVDKRRLSPEDSIAAISGAGGVAVLAHPIQMKLDGYEASEAMFEKLKKAGLGGVEVYHSSQNKKVAKNYRQIAERLGLVATGGSDFHGEAKKDVKLGILSGAHVLDQEVVEELRARAKAA